MDEGLQKDKKILNTHTACLLPPHPFFSFAFCFYWQRLFSMLFSFSLALTIGRKMIYIPSDQFCIDQVYVASQPVLSINDDKVLL